MSLEWKIFDVEPEKIENENSLLLSTKRFHVLGIPLEIKYQDGYEGNNRIDTGHLFGEYYTISMVEVMRKTLSSFKGESSILDTYNLKKNTHSSSSSSAAAMATATKQEDILRDFLKRCVLISCSVFETQNTFPFSIEIELDQTDLPFVIPYEEGSRGNSPTEINKIPPRECVPPVDLILYNQFNVQLEMSILDLIQYKDEFMTLLRPQPHEVNGVAGKDDHNRKKIKPVENSVNRVTYFSESGRAPIEYVFIDKNKLYYDFTRKMVQHYVDSIVPNLHSTESQTAQTPSSKGGGQSQPRGGNNNAISMSYPRSMTGYTNQETLVRHVLQHREDPTTWRIEQRIFKSAFEHCFLPVDRYQAFYEKKMGIGDKLRVGLRGFDSREHLKESRLSSVDNLKRVCKVRLVLYVVLPWAK